MTRASNEPIPPTRSAPPAHRSVPRHYPSLFGIQFNSDIRAAKVGEEDLQHSLRRLFCAGGYQTAYGGKVHVPIKVEDIGFTDITKNERLGLAEAAAGFIRQPHDKPWLLVTSFSALMPSITIAGCHALLADMMAELKFIDSSSCKAGRSNAKHNELKP